MMPTNVAARMTLAADPELAPGRGRRRDPRRRPRAPRHGRAVRAAARRGAGRRSPRAAIRRQSPPRSRARASAPPAAGCPGFGHPVHRPLDPARRADPRACRRARGERRRTSRSPARFATRVAEVWGKPLTMNVSLPIAAVMLDLGFPAVGREVGADPRAHRRPARPPRRGARAPARVPDGRRRPRRRSSTTALMLEPEVETRPWDEQLALDDASYRDQLAYLFERSAFYRDKLARPGSTRPQRPAASTEIAELPLTEKRELRETVTPENPIGAHLCATPRGDRPHLLDERHDRHAELHPAHRRRPRQLGRPAPPAATRPRGRRRRADRLDLQRRPVRRGRGASARSSGSGSATSRSAPATPSG